jgi:hypothetical protein
MPENCRSDHGRAAGTRSTAQPAITGLIQEYGGRWTIAYQLDLSVWSAERRSQDGRSRWFICDREPALLAARLADAEAGQ